MKDIASLNHFLASYSEKMKAPMQTISIAMKKLRRNDGSAIDKKDIQSMRQTVMGMENTLGMLKKRLDGFEI